MSKVIGIDFGLKRTGIAITDELQMIASPLESVETVNLISYLDGLFQSENIEVIVLGEAKHLDGNDSDMTIHQNKLAVQLQKKYPGKTIVRVNEMFTSKLASQSLVAGGFKKSDRAKKGNIDKISAALILRSYLESRPGYKY